MYTKIFLKKIKKGIALYKKSLYNGLCKNGSHDEPIMKGDYNYDESGKQSAEERLRKQSRA